MSSPKCPECKADGRSQKWHKGYAQTLETPKEEAGWECLKCGHEYPDDGGYDDGRADYEYDQMRDREINEAWEK